MYVDMGKGVWAALPDNKDLIYVTTPLTAGSLHSQRKIEHGLN